MQTTHEEVLFDRNATPVKPVSDEVASQSRTNTQLIVNRLNTQGHKSVAECIGKDVSTISKWISSKEIDRVGLMLAILGLKVVPVDWQVMDKSAVHALLVLSQKVTIDQLTSTEG